MKSAKGSILGLAACVSFMATGAQAANILLFNPYPEINTTTWQLSDGWANGEHQACEWRADAISAKDNNLVFTLSDNGGKLRPYSCGEMHTQTPTGYGTYEVRMRSAAGSGLNSAFFTYIGPPTGGAVQDEIDFEFLGKDPHTVDLNYFSNNISRDGTPVKLGFDASAAMHTYSFIWAPDKISWYADGKLIHETPAGAVIPKTPGRIYLSLWAGAAVENAWMGPFSYSGPATSEVAWVKFTAMRP